MGEHIVRDSTSGDERQDAAHLIRQQVKDQTVLIVGYGSAGRRHAEMARSFGFKQVVTVDPIANASYSKIRDAARIESVDVAVIASPPMAHLFNIEDIHMFWPDAKILCEKPLCDLGQLHWARYLQDVSWIMPAYNYRFHPVVEEARGFENQYRPDENSVDRYWTLNCRQRRAYHPEWGFLLDHLSHDIDILGTVVNKTPIVTAAYFEQGGDEIAWTVSGILGNGIFDINERIYKDTDVKREAVLKVGAGEDEIIYSLYATPEMFEKLWITFLSNNNGLGFSKHLNDALETQKVLENIYRYANHK